eukprot:TRINITY_DN17326_c0_g2_i1.p1 TRINITY_DN17326_c0_g2~~TRINITY_DN17326_c0_g2_i1.p1  ORF type:complete len:271 (-),score=83.97 TRINITY_DN17326_c0_g2_i1:75-887(-)
MCIRDRFESLKLPSIDMKDEKQISEEQLIDITKNCFLEIAEYMKQKNTSALALYKDVITKKKIGNTEIDVLTPLDFLNGLRKLGIDDLQSPDYTCLIKVLSMKDAERHIQVSDIVQLLEDYGVIEVTSEEQELIGEFRYEELDKISAVVMLGLAEYLKRNGITTESLFGAVEYKQGIEVDGKKLKVELINSKDFFAVLNSIGIFAEEEAHKNLKAFLALDPSHPDKILAKKLKKRIEEFSCNEELRIHAQSCYQELIAEEKLHDAQKSSQ